MRQENPRRIVGRKGVARSGAKSNYLLHHDDQKPIDTAASTITGAKGSSFSLTRAVIIASFYSTMSLSTRTRNRTRRERVAEPNSGTHLAGPNSFVAIERYLRMSAVETFCFRALPPHLRKQQTPTAGSASRTSELFAVSVRLQMEMSKTETPPGVNLLRLRRLRKKVHVCPIASIQS